MTFPMRVREDADFRIAQTPVCRWHLAAEGLGKKFSEHESGWAGFVEARPVVG